MCPRSFIYQQFWTPLFGKLETIIYPAAAYHSKTGQQIELVNRKLQNIIRVYVDFGKSNCYLYFTSYEVAYSIPIHTSTSPSPFHLNNGQRPRVNLLYTLNFMNPTAADILDYILKYTKIEQENIEKQNIAKFQQANKTRVPPPIKVIDQVLLSKKYLLLEDENVSTKFHSKICGSFRITEKINNITIRLNLPQPVADKKITMSFIWDTYSRPNHTTAANIQVYWRQYRIQRWKHS